VRYNEVYAALNFAKTVRTGNIPTLQQLLCISRAQLQATAISAIEGTFP